jgi:hypothetical protein
MHWPLVSPPASLLQAAGSPKLRQLPPRPPRRPKSRQQLAYKSQALLRRLPVEAGCTAQTV